MYVMYYVISINRLSASRYLSTYLPFKRLLNFPMFHSETKNSPPHKTSRRKPTRTLPVPLSVSACLCLCLCLASSSSSSSSSSPSLIPHFSSLIPHLFPAPPSHLSFLHLPLSKQPPPEAPVPTFLLLSWSRRKKSHCSFLYCKVQLVRSEPGTTIHIPYLELNGYNLGTYIHTIHIIHTYPRHKYRKLYICSLV